MQENKIKTMRIYFCNFNEHLECGNTMKMRWNSISRIKQSTLLCMKTIIFFSNKCQCQPTKLHKPDSSVDELRDDLFTINSLINYTDDSCIRTRILMTTNESRYIPRH